MYTSTASHLSGPIRSHILAVWEVPHFSGPIRSHIFLVLCARLLLTLGHVVLAATLTVVFLSCPHVKKHSDLFGSFLYQQSTMKDMYSKPETELNPQFQ